MAFSAVYDLVIDDRDLRIYSNGTGQPVLMLPDLGSSAATWESLTGEVVDNDRQLVAVDLPGTGHCDPVRGSDLAAFVDHTRQVIEHLTTEPIALVGCGFGGYLAASVAAQDPHLVSRLVLERPHCATTRSGPPVSARMPAGMAIGGALTTLRRGRIKQNAAGFSRARTVLEQLAKADPQWWQSLPQITAPTLIIGSSTDAGDRAQLDLLAAAIPGSTRTDLSGARRGHASDPKGFAAVTMPFLCAG